ncbi:MAG: nucleotidyl transferase AbiEii/AbiGii toxin family protein [Chloroflexi bacterium]|nr:nucleotidyl transferase AbiEii/AbiGii toxin family protein [Chloroflexota bacterium]
MISFGELRKKSVAWQVEISAVEKIYALDWLLKGIFDRAELANALTLRGASALANAYFENYPRVEDADFARAASLDDATLERALDAAVTDAARASGLQFKLHSVQPTAARIEFTGPLGRRSAAQPLIVARFVPTPTRLEPATGALLHPFGDGCETNVRAVALEELAAERIVLYSQKPRARDVFDLWFILTHGANALDVSKTRDLAQRLAAEKGVVLRAELDAQYAPLLERAWENALKGIQPHFSFAQTQQEIENRLGEL